MYLVLETVGIFVFALSGASLAVRRDFDLVGMAVLAETTALGGGVLRDVLLGATPPAAFTQPGYLITPLIATAVVFVGHRLVERLDALVQILDAAGVGLFCVVGAIKALEFHQGALPAVILGATTAVGGGLLRDLLADQAPTVLRRDSQMYVIPAILGGGIVVVADLLGLMHPVVPVVAACLAISLRILALQFGWGAPHPPRRPAATNDQ